jgi:hypothetical protein
MPRPKKPAPQPAPPAPPVPPSKTSHLFSPRKPTERNSITHERIAADLEAFYRSGGEIEVLGVTRSLKKIDGGEAAPPAPAKARR